MAKIEAEKAEAATGVILFFGGGGEKEREKERVSALGAVSVFRSFSKRKSSPFKVSLAASIFPLSLLPLLALLLSGQSNLTRRLLRHARRGGDEAAHALLAGHVCEKKK